MNHRWKSVKNDLLKNRFGVLYYLKNNGSAIPGTNDRRGLPLGNIINSRNKWTGIKNNKNYMKNLMTAGSTEWTERISESAGVLGVKPDLHHCRLFALHAKELIKWNRRINLTAITEPEDMALKHFVDSIVITRLIPPKSRVLDIGSGAGFPGIPLKIMLPSVSVLLIDAVRKKVSFLQHIIRTLDLKAIRAVHIRARELAEQSEYGETFDVIVCRALSSLDQFVTMALPLMKPKGRMIAMKGRISQMEIDAVSGLNIDGLCIEMEQYRLPVMEAERTLVKIWRNPV